ncbi:MAG: biotin--[acetyl-CoA-carboxylase] ligase [Gammaproteobacteria bacterium]|nr:biotin--[acetyl-CoA-carboxylase] ligase [Gammaproteobacteria bacterium]
MSNDDKLSSIVRTLSLADSNLENLIANQDELTIALNLAADYGLMITHNNGLYTLENKLKILDKSIIYNHLELLNTDTDIELSIKDFVNTTTEEFDPREIKNNELKISIAEFQKQGRGRQNRKWFSPFGAGISSSIFKHLSKNINPIGLSLYLGIRIIDALDEIGFHGIKLKWPNDLYYKDKKLGGILVDIYQNSDLDSVISLGIGINYCLPDNKNFNFDTKKTPIDLCSIIKDENIDRSIVAGHLLKRVIENLDSFNENSLKDEQERWKEIDYLYAKTITIEVVDKQITGINKGITSDGELILEVDSKRIKIITGHIVV